MRGLVAVLGLLALSVFFSGCNPFFGTGKETLQGEWIGYDSYTITESALEYDDGGWGFDYKGDIVSLNDKYICVKITEKGNGLGDLEIGEYFVVSYKDLTENTVCFSNAYKATDGQKSFKTKKEALSTQTEENGWFGYYGEYARKK